MTAGSEGTVGPAGRTHGSVLFDDAFTNDELVVTTRRVGIPSGARRLCRTVGEVGVRRSLTEGWTGSSVTRSEIQDAGPIREGLRLLRQR